MRARIALLGLLAVVSTAWAQEDGLSLNAAYRLQRDDNLFRLADGVDPQAVLGRPDAAESVQVRSLSLRYARAFGLQRLEADVGLVDYTYDTYRQLDLLARNHDLRWRWAVTPWLTGSLRTQRDESVNSFDDATVLTRGNRRVRRFDGADLRWQLDGAWSLVADVQEVRNANEQPLIGEESTRLRSGAVGLRRDTPKGSSAAFRWRSGRGETIDPDRAPVPLRDDDFQQDEWLLDLRWAASARTRIDANIARIERRHERVALRDFDATNVQARVDWEPGARTLLRWTVGSDTASYQTDNASLARTDRWALLAQWAITPRLSLQAQTGEARRRYLRPPPGANPDPRRDRTRESSLGLTWGFADNASADLRWLHNRRHSTDASARYRSNGVQLGLSARF
ncbi:MAG: XrtB/PEP-CTERM-associated polysaccharide biosynthesis outer membrane protein EpsL [Hydrogenophaga sp.]